MKEILKKLIDKWRCRHDWNSVKSVSMEGDWAIYHLVCKKCGKRKRMRIKIYE